MFLAAGCVVLAVVGGGCQSGMVSKPMPAKLYANDADAQMDFWHTLAERRLASNDEAFHGLLLYLDGKDPAANYQERVKLLKQRNLLPASFNGLANEAVTRGTLSVPIVRVLKIKGGLIMRLTGPNERYALRELQYLGLYPTSSPNQAFSGAEFVGIIGKLDDYQAGDAALAPGIPYQ